MLSLPRVLVLVFATFAVSGLAASTSTSSDGYQPLNPVGIVTRSLRPKADVYLTNAQRLARGLPPNRPRRNGRPASSSKPSPSSTCVTKTGYIQADVARQWSGYVSKKVNAYGEYGFTHDVSKALSISYCAKRGSGTVDIATSVCFDEYFAFVLVLIVNRMAPHLTTSWASSLGLGTRTSTRISTVATTIMRTLAVCPRVSRFLCSLRHRSYSSCCRRTPWPRCCRWQLLHRRDRCSRAV